MGGSPRYRHEVLDRLPARLIIEGMSMAIATEVPELAVVEFTHSLGAHHRGTLGVVVSAHPDRDAYTVEITDAHGRTVDLVSAHADDLRVTEVV